jgi:DNA-binding CsgD family transcriptional regulator
MNNPILNEVYKKWTEIGSPRPLDELQLDLLLYKKLLDIVQVGESYHFIFFPAHSKVELVSPSVQKVLGIPASDFSANYLLNNIHPQDLPFLVDFEATVVDFKKNLPVDKLMKYKPRYNYRLRRRNDDYIHILQQSITIQADEDGAILYNLIMHTDISDIAPFQHMKLSFIGLEDEPSYIDVMPQTRFSKTKGIFSSREKEVLKLVIQGLNSEAIAIQLNRSIHTVRTHRKNILRKSECSNIQELLVKAIREGWV